MTVKLATVEQKKKPVSALARLEARPILAQAGTREIEIPLEKIRFDPTQPRKAFHHIDGRVDKKDQAYIDELAESIEKNNLIQAITVQEQADGTYLVVVGECRTRAHLQLGRKTIRATVRNDLVDGALRLMVQLAENVNRQDLTDQELALSIRALMQGADGVAPMTQTAVAKYLGKSEGWVTRFVKFGDEELQRVWVQTGISEGAENTYRLSLLPKALQIDVIRRVNLPETDPEFLAKPLNRGVIDEYSREGKIVKQAARIEKQSGTPPVDAIPIASMAPLPPAVGAGERAGVATDDVIGRAFAEAAEEAHEPRDPVVEKKHSLDTGGYKLPETDRLKQIGAAAVIAAEMGSSDRSAVQPPVNCRVSVSNLEALLDILKSHKSILAPLQGTRCDVHFPMPLAQLVANELMGMIVSEKELPALLQAELVKLG